jgi:hypothetical protein
MKKLPTECPSCRSRLEVSRLVCNHCNTQIEGSFELPALASLAPEDQEFIFQFVLNDGSLKEMAKLSGVSYPTVRNLLDGVVEKLRAFQRKKEKSV